MDRLFARRDHCWYGGTLQRLSAPLGKRKLIDGATGLPILQFSARQFLRPRLLPPGYRLWLVRPMLAAPQGASRGQPVAGAQLWYSPPPVRPYREALDQLIITEYVDRPFVPGPWQCLPQAKRPSGDEGQWTPIRIRGVWGCAESGNIAWRQHGLDYLIGVDSPVGTRPLLSSAQLVAIAASAPD